jgi:transcription elongation factor GreA
MIDNTTYLTREGYDKLKHELEGLVHVKRKEIANRIQEAKELGDLSENAEYQGAREEQAFNEGRIEEIEGILRTAIIIDEKAKKKEIVQVGSSVVIKSGNQEKSIHLVGSNEADPAQGFVSNVSPLGQAILGKSVGEKVSVEAPKGVVEYEITQIT